MKEDSAVGRGVSSDPARAHATHLGVKRKRRLPALWRDNLADAKLCLARLVGHTLDVSHGMGELVNGRVEDWAVLEAEQTCARAGRQLEGRWSVCADAGKIER